jgi:purine nucleoside permease
MKSLKSLKSTNLLHILSLFALIFAAGSLIVRADTLQTNPPKFRPVKVMVITMFEIPGAFAGETQKWIEGEGLTEEIPVPGLSPNFPSVFCKPESRDNDRDNRGGNDRNRFRGSDVCVITTDIGYANAATSITALLYSGKFDFRDTYFLIAGIAGVDPADGTLGSAAWARYSVDFGLAHEIDAREMPADWPYGYTGFGPVATGLVPTRVIGTEVYQLNEALLQKAFNLSKDVVLTDNADSQAYRALYPNPPANQPPKVTICDSVAVDTYWHGTLLSKRANDWAKLLTNGAANYCMTNEEDNATLTALKRGANAKLLKIDRVAVLRTASNFDQQHPNQTPFQSLTTRSGGFVPSVTNAYLVGSKLVRDITGDWRRWREGVPPDGPLTVKPK